MLPTFDHVPFTTRPWHVDNGLVWLGLDLARGQWFGLVGTRPGRSGQVRSVNGASERKSRKFFSAVRCVSLLRHFNHFYN